jgi:7-alpha-hydroxysteroid dehydrogenase
MSFSISGKTAIVTGAANGVGLAIARHFADVGANVMFADMDEERLSQEVGEIGGEESNTSFFAGDLRERLTIANLLSATIDAFDRVDILVNASRQVLYSDPQDIDDDSIDVMLSQNLLAPLRLSQLVARRMIKQAKGSGPDAGSAGSIVNLSSIAAERTHPALMAFSVSAAALNQMTRSMAVSLSGHRIRVNAVAIGSVMSASLKDRLKESGAGLRDEIIDHTPLGRIASPGEAAEAAQFLSSESAGFITGQVLTLDGGRTLIDAVADGAH